MITAQGGWRTGKGFDPNEGPVGFYQLDATSGEVTRINPPIVKALNRSLTGYIPALLTTPRGLLLSITDNSALSRLA